MRMPRAPAEVPLESDVFHRDAEDPRLNCFMQHRRQVTKSLGKLAAETTQNLRQCN